MKRLKTPKTYKAYIDGAFARSESGRHLKLERREDSVNIPHCSRKDVRNAVVGAKKAQGSWSRRSAFNRSQILYRIAEMLEARSAQFIEELIAANITSKKAIAEVELTIDRCIYYAGWCDKYASLAGTVNSVSSAHFNFSIPEPQGICGLMPDNTNLLLDSLSLILPAICGGNSVVVLVPFEASAVMLSFSEVLHTSDLPAGVVQLLTGESLEMAKPLSEHMEVNSLVFAQNEKSLTALEENGHVNLKRTMNYSEDWSSKKSQGIKFIMDLQEIKTTWHPIESSLGSGGKY
jgi:acyl-CoA reductase-like NAD-dependent aldehyde dehydrogenase